MRCYSHADTIIRTQMVRCGYTMETLSAQTGISPAVLRAILTGRAKTISTRNICALAAAFDFSMSDLMDLLSETPLQSH